MKNIELLHLSIQALPRSYHTTEREFWELVEQENPDAEWIRDQALKGDENALAFLGYESRW